MLFSSLVSFLVAYRASCANIHIQQHEGSGTFFVDPSVEYRDNVTESGTDFGGWAAVVGSMSSGISFSLGPVSI